jgi:hypothetical protein
MTMKEKIFLLLISFCLALSAKAQSELMISNFEDKSPAFDSWDIKGIDVVANPLPGGINTTDSALQVYTSDLVTWEGIKTYPEPLDYTTLNTFSVLVYSEMEGQVLLKIEGEGGTHFDLRNNYTEEGTWQELTFDLSGGTSNVDTLVALFPDVDGTSDSIAWYFDEIKLISETDPDPGSAELNKITFETEGADYDWIVFDNTTADNDPTAFTIVDNPDPSGVNTSTKVGKYEMHVGAAMWAGVKTNDLDPIIITEANKWFIMDVYKTDMDTVGLKVEPPSTNGVLVTLVPETSGEWETMAFDFSAAVGDTFPTFVIFPDWTGLTRSEEIIYFDNIEWSPTANRPVALNNKSIQREVSLYPNPASTLIYVTANGSEIAQIEMFDILGSTVFHINSNQEKQCIDVSSFERGMYILSVTSITGNVSSMKVILK